jgi:hypothetical protein
LVEGGKPRRPATDDRRPTTDDRRLHCNAKPLIPTGDNPMSDEPINAVTAKSRRDHPRCCTAHKTNGDPCQRYATRGSNVCRLHGGAAPQTVAKARERLALAADRMARELLGIAEGAESEAVKLAAVKDALDRAGLSAKTAVEVDVSVKPYEEVFNDIAHITRAQHQALMAGQPPPAQAELPQRQPDPYYDTPAPTPKAHVRNKFEDDNVIDAEVVPLETMEEANASVAAANRAAGVYAARPTRRKRR